MRYSRAIEQIVKNTYGSIAKLTDEQLLFLNEIHKIFEKQSAELIKLRDDSSSAANALDFLLNQISEVYVKFDLALNKVTYISSGCERVYGYSPDEMITNGSTWQNIFLQDDLSFLPELLKKILNKEAVTKEFQIKHRNGNSMWIEVKCIPVTDSVGKVTMVDFIISNLTERLAAEKNESETESKYRDLFEKTVDGIYKSSHQGKFLEVNPALVSMLGYSSKEELMSIDIKANLYFETSERDNAVMQDVTEGISVFRLKKKDGSEIWVEDRGQYVNDKDGNILYHEGILRDVTKRVEAEFLLSKSERETADYRKALDQSLIVSIADDKGVITYANENFCNISGYNINELIGLDQSVLNDDYSAGDLMNDLMKTINKGEVWRSEVKNRSKSGYHYWTETTIVPFLNESGKPYQFLSLSVDITERKDAQEDILSKNKELQKTNSELDKFVYSISHDLRAPICSIQGIINVSLEETSDPIIKENLRLIDSGAQRLDVLIHDILDYSSNARTKVVREEINFKEIIKEITESVKYRNTKSKGTAVRYHILKENGYWGDRRRITAILNNLITNGIMYCDSAKPNPFVEVSISITEMNVILEVKDNGIGINEKHIEKIYDMFYRVSEGSVGSGLGLYIVKETVSKLNGSIEVESNPGSGTRFIVHLPNYLMYN